MRVDAHRRPHGVREDRRRRVGLALEPRLEGPPGLAAQACLLPAHAHTGVSPARRARTARFAGSRLRAASETAPTVAGTTVTPKMEKPVEGSREWWRAIAADATRRRRQEQRSEFGRLFFRVTIKTIWSIAKLIVMLGFWYLIGYPIWVVLGRILEILTKMK